jgi:hypothetical protein
VVRVSTEAQLQAAVSSLVSGTTILIESGTYNLSSTLWLNRGVRDVAIRGTTNSCDDVVLVGRGMATSSYGSVPHGIWIGNAQRVLIANLTIRDVYYHPIQLDPNSGAQAPHIYNVRLVNAGQQFIKSSASTSGSAGVNNGMVEYSVMEYATTAPSDYTNGVDVHGGSDWVIRNNLSRNIVAPSGQLAGPAVLMWRRSRNTIVERNLFVNVHRGIALGFDPAISDDHLGGIIRNNFIVRTNAQPGDVGITINNASGAKILNNTVILSGTYPDAIEYRFQATMNVEIRYNLTDATVRSRDGASGVVAGNVTNAQPTWFLNAGAGDLHLASTASLAVDKAMRHADVSVDYDGAPRSGVPDVGADEHGAGSSDAIRPAAPPDLQVR